jgi:hypothetical protein
MSIAASAAGTADWSIQNLLFPFHATGGRFQHYNTTTLQHYNTTILQHCNTTTLQHYNTTTLQHYNTTTLQHYNTATLQHCNTATLQRYCLQGSMVCHRPLRILLHY